MRVDVGDEGGGKAYSRAVNLWAKRTEICHDLIPDAGAGERRSTVARKRVIMAQGKHLKLTEKLIIFPITGRFGGDTR